MGVQSPGNIMLIFFEIPEKVVESLPEYILYILGVKVRNMKMDFNTGGTWRRFGQ